MARSHSSYGCSDMIAEVVLQTIWAVFYFSVALPVGAIGRLIPNSAYHRSVALGKVPTDNPRTWGLGGTLVLLGLGALCYFFWRWPGLAVVMGVAAIVITLGWFGAFEEYEKKGRRRQRKSSKRGEGTKA